MGACEEWADCAFGELEGGCGGEHDLGQGKLRRRGLGDGGIERRDKLHWRRGLGDGGFGRRGQLCRRSWGDGEMGRRGKLHWRRGLGDGGIGRHCRGGFGTGHGRDELDMNDKRYRRG